MSLKVFYDENIDVGIVEVGIGGANDVTNLIQPTVCAITLIDFDHMNLLGNTITEIAGQKSGIIKVRNRSLMTLNEFLSVVFDTCCYNEYTNR